MHRRRILRRLFGTPRISMKAVIKFVMIVVGLGLIAVSVAGLIFSSRLEGRLRPRLESRLGHIMGTDVEIAALRIAPARRGIELSDVTVLNPPSFKLSPALECKKITVRPVFQSLFSSAPTIEEILLDGMTIHLRYELGEGTNLGHMARQAATLAEQPATGWSMMRRPVRVNAVRCSGADMKIRSNVTPGVPLSLRIEAFELKDVGEGRPVSAAKLTSIILKSILMEAVTLKGLFRPIVDLIRDEAQ